MTFNIGQITVLLFPVTFLTTYGISVYLGHSDPVWPYISDTGKKVPRDERVIIL